MTDARGALALRGSFPLPQEPSNAGAGDLVEFTDLIRALPLESAPATPRTGLLGRVEPADRPGLNDCTSARIAPTVHANNHSVLVEGRLGRHSSFTTKRRQCRASCGTLSFLVN